MTAPLVLTTPECCHHPFGTGHTSLTHLLLPQPPAASFCCKYQYKYYNLV